MNRPKPPLDPSYFGEPENYKPYVYDPLNLNESWSGSFTDTVAPKIPMYIDRAEKQYQCKRCRGLVFEVFNGSYWTGIRCPTCLWEECIHEG